MHNWESILISPGRSILEALEIIDKGALQIALVTDENHNLLGTVTDGDVRRGLLRGITLDKPVKTVMNAKPTVVVTGSSKQKILSIMQSKKLRHIPVVDSNGRLIGMEFIDQLMTTEQKDNWVLLMAGGLGNRLRPLTDNCPKPLLNVGGKPVLETILDSFIEQGFSRFYISVNYKAEMIKKYFGDGSYWGVQIKYLHEKKKLGTAGALGLLPTPIEKPMIVMNGDILTKVDFRHLLNFHQEQQVQATMCVREYHMQIPYGVVKINKYKLRAIEEKPLKKFFVNAGLYVLDPGILNNYVPANTYLDMPTLFDNLIKQKKETAIFPIREYWMDIGKHDDYERANGEFAEVFG
ncbi:MAG: nucleotidyltransferase family protein [Syntrophomonadaceae bacterium]